MRRIFLTLLIVLAVAALAVGPALAQGAPPPPSSSGYVRYVVQPGDTLASIARRFCTTTSTIYSLNAQTIGPNPNAIWAGMVLWVPNQCGGAPPPPGGVYDHGPRPHAMGSVQGNMYYVVLGDTMFSVSARFGLTVQQLAAANGIHNPWWIYPGQKLIIPGLGGPPSQPPPQPPPQPSPQPCTPTYPSQPCQQPCTPQQPCQQPCTAPQPCPSPCPPQPQPCPSPSPAPKPTITITSPAAGAILSATFEVKGTGSGLVEGNVVVRALDGQGMVLAEKATIVQSPDAGTGGAGPWAVTLTVSVTPGTAGKLTASSPGTPNAPVASVNVVYGTQPEETKSFAPGVCKLQGKPNAPFSTYPNGPQAGTFVAGGTYESLQSTKTGGMPWYEIFLDPGSGNPGVWVPLTSIAAYYQGCVW